MRVLIVDDSRAARAVLRRMLKDFGFEILEAGNGREGVALLSSGSSADLALVDWNMPEMNGLEFVVAVRADPQYASMRIVMVTSEAEIAQMVRALEAGANEYIMKPFTAEILREKLELLGVTAA